MIGLLGWCLIPKVGASEPGPVSTGGYYYGILMNYQIDQANPEHITGDFIDQFLSTYYPDSPLVGYGSTILGYSEQYGVNVGIYLGQIAKETTFGRAVCGGQYNFGCIMWTESSGFGPAYAAGRAWIDPPTVEAGIEAQFRLIRNFYIDQGYGRYGDYLERYSPSYENDHSSFEALAYGVFQALRIPITSGDAMVPQPGLMPELQTATDAEIVAEIVEVDSQVVSEETLTEDAVKSLVEINTPLADWYLDLLSEK